VAINRSAGSAKTLWTSFPGIGDRLLLEIVAEGKIAQHLEKGEMARGVADIVEVVVLAAGAHAFLCGDGTDIGTLVLAGEHALELHHARIGEEQRGSLRGTSGEDGTGSWPRSRKNSTNVERISDRLFMICF